MTQRRSHDRGFSLIEAMVASMIMLIGLLGLAGLQVVGVRANHLGKRMAQASLLASELTQNMQIWPYADARLQPVNNTGVFNNTNANAIKQYWDVGTAATPASTFDFAEGATGASRVSQLNTNYTGVRSPLDDAGNPIFSRYWNVYNMDLSGSGTTEGKLVQVLVRWKEPGFGYRQVTTSFFRYDPGVFSQ